MISTTIQVKIGIQVHKIVLVKILDNSAHEWLLVAAVRKCSILEKGALTFS